MEREIDVSAILESYKKGSRKEYDRFLADLSDPSLKPEIMQHYMQGLRDCVVQLDKHHQDVVGVVLRIHWTCLDPQVIKDYQSLVLNLVSAHTDYLKAGLRMLIKNLKPDIPKPDNGKSVVGVDIEDSVKKKHEESFIQVHRLLKAINQIVPMTSVLLLPLVTENFPYLGKDTYIQECYVRNLLQVTLYMPTHRLKILELIVDQLIKIDVHCPRNEILEAEEEREEEMEEETCIFNLDEASDMKENVNGSSVSSMCHPYANKLDVLLDLVFGYIRNICYTNEELNWEATKTLYREMLSVFEKIILPTYGSCHVQFLMFYLCAMKPALCEGFLDFLWKRVQDPNNAAVFRQTAVVYMASLQARGNFVPVSTVKSCMTLMMQWLHSYLDECGQECVIPDIAHHGSFYTVCQAVFYIFVFRSKELLDLRKGLKWAESLNFQRLVTSRLNPLKVCLPVIAKTFSSVTRQHQLAFCDTIMERNSRSTLRVASPTFGSGSTPHQKMLDTFFPFDPYMLHRSMRFISPHYREFSGTLEDNGSQNDSSDDDDEMFTDIDKKGSRAAEGFSADIAVTPGSASVDKHYDFMNYSTSPGFQHL